MKNRGFTLVELLGVLILLAVILTLVFPSVLNLITNSRGEVKSLTNKLVENAANLYIDSNKDKFDEQNGNSYCVTLSELVSEGYIKSPIVFSDTDEDQTELKSVQINYNNGYTYELKNNDECVEHIPYKEELLNGSDPELFEGLYPVIYDEDKSSWVIADLNEKWYSYQEQWWANAVVLKKGIEKHSGDEITVDGDDPEALAMFVWIPRYSYTISSTAKGESVACNNMFSELCYPNPGAIDIKFINKSTKDTGTATYDGNTPSGWLTHPAFTFGSKELSGYWMGKFETSHATFSSKNEVNSLNCSNENCESADGLRVLPNQIALTNNNVANFFYASRSMSREGNAFGLNKDKIDTHMSKNIEWAAVAYLTQSLYGKYNNSSYTGENKEVYTNNSSRNYTGRSLGAPTTSKNSSTTEGTYHYDVKNSGTGASTTGNIYGIYDMSGGIEEFVMGVAVDKEGIPYVFNGDKVGLDGQKTGFNGKNSDDTLETNEAELPDEKYYDKYNLDNISYSVCVNSTCNGQAFGETLSWYNDECDYVQKSTSWVTRGGGSGVSDVKVGIFQFYVHGGIPSGVGFRLILS